MISKMNKLFLSLFLFTSAISSKGSYYSQTGNDWEQTHTKKVHPVKNKRRVEEYNSEAVTWAKSKGHNELIRIVRSYMESDAFHTISTLNQRRIRRLNKKLNCGSLELSAFNTLLEKSQNGVKVLFDGIMDR